MPNTKRLLTAMKEINDLINNPQGTEPNLSTIQAVLDTVIQDCSNCNGTGHLSGGIGSLLCIHCHGIGMELIQL